MSRTSELIDNVEAFLLHGKRTPPISRADICFVIELARKSESLETELRSYKQHVCDACEGEGMIQDGLCGACKGTGMAED